jgi:hypothetical protein
MTTQVLVRLPVEVAMRLRLSVPARKRSGYISSLLEKALPNIDEQMYQLGLQAEAYDQEHPAERVGLECTLMDGLDPHETFDTSKLLELCQK